VGVSFAAEQSPGADRLKDEKAESVSMIRIPYLRLSGSMLFLGGPGRAPTGPLATGRTASGGHKSQHEDFDSPPTRVVDHPGYNRDRGPILAPALRLHLEF
jgi:hypothetical protein